MTQTIPKVYVARFFQLVTTRQFAEAERVLERLKQKIKLNERNRGYYQALYGMLLAQKNNDDRYAFLSNLNITDKKELHNYRREFLRQSEYRLHADYDRGFFSAWADFMRIISKLELSSVPTPNNKNNTPKEQETEQAEPEKMEEATQSRRGQEAGDTEAIEKAVSADDVEPRQSILSDFSK